ncbi:ABC transporter ATP-binding protein [Streptococcus suis]|uniref:ABC transporter ATP-binding protein n=1 Tax=Streptococcus suis TaxID=1307 RepID=A0A4V4RWT9_STRSU|nr:ABC transporter ATP-binding protein [Streptococcus suis]MBM7269100.1 ABC transporter ATP-binding protein [Streptococcus suis]TII01135.1 ABC transporter ATP-binding protein [Streptococcus suis]
MKELVGYFHAYLKEAILAPLFKLLEASFELVVPLIIAMIIDQVIPNSNQGNLVAMILYLVALAIVGVVVSLTAQYFAAKAAVGFTKDLTQDLYQKILSLPKASRDSLSSSSLFTRLTSDTLQIQSGINIFLRLFLRAPIVVFGSLLMAYLISPSLATYFVNMIILLFLVVTVISWVTSRHYQSIRKFLDSLVGQVRETVTGMRVIRAFGQNLREKEAFEKGNQAYLGQLVRAGRWSSSLSPLTYLIVNLTLIFLIWQGSFAITFNQLEQGMLIALINYLLQILVELVKMVMVISSLNQSFIAAKRVQEIFDQQSEDVEAPLSTTQTDQMNLVLSVQNLTFTYPRSSRPALENLSFQLEKGQFMGIIGGTGSGKSTLIDLLLGLYPSDDNKVQVYIEGHSPQTLANWRGQFALVPQQAQLFSGTVRSNLTLGKVYSEQALWKALEMAQAKDFLLEKDGLDTVVEAFGRNFSGGQRQRLTIARALVQEASILILDDATSALDYLTESRLFAAIRRELPQQTLIVISQRTKSIKDANQILVLDKGKQVGLGCHQDLLESSAIFREIDRSQQSQEVES